MRPATRVVLRAVGAALLTFIALTGPALAGPSYQVPLGPRAIGMGGAFSAIADDASAIFWNPAGLSRIDNQEIMVTSANLYGLEIQDNFAAFVLPLSRNNVAAVGWYRSGFDDDELAFGENIIDLAYGMRPYSWLSVGATAKYLSRGTDLDGVEVSSGNGLGLDLGVLATPWRGLRLGLVGQDAFDTKIKFDEGTSEAYPRNMRIAAAYAFGSRGVVALDVDDRYHMGGELRLFDMVALRAGVERDREGSEDPQYSLGGGIEYGVLRFDYAYVDHPVLDGTHHAGLSLAFNFNPARVRIEKIETRDIYGSLYKSYASAPVATAVVRNLDESPLAARISTFIPGVMDGPTEQQVILRPKAVQEIPITAVFSRRAVEHAGDRPIQVELQVSYQSQRLARTERKSETGMFYGPGAIDWGLGTAQAAAFVTPRDPVVDALAREIARSLDDAAAVDFPSREIRYAAAMLNALGVMGVAYVPDPHNPYSTVSETAHAVDTIHYPRETLSTRSGDCDDTTVLLASLLANVGVRTQLVDVPGHVFLLLDTGIHERNRLAMRVDDGLYVVSGDAVWVPIETTALGKGFAEAWRTGADEYRTWSARGRLELVDISDAQRLYAPAELPASASVPGPDGLAVGEQLSRDAAVLLGWQEEYLAQRYGEVREDTAASPSALGQLAHIYYRGGDAEKARWTLERVLESDPGSPSAHNNLAVALVALGDRERALEHCLEAVNREPDDAGIWLNVGILRYVSGDGAGSSRALSEGLARCRGFADACWLLGLRVADDASRAAAESLTAEEIIALLQDVLAKLPAPEVTVTAGDTTSAAAAVAGGSSAEPVAAKPPKSITLRVAASRAADRMDLSDCLYWKQEETP